MNNIYVTGNFTYEYLNLYNSDSSSCYTLTNEGQSSYMGRSYNTFVTKYDSNGTPLWGSLIGGLTGNNGTSICTDNSYAYVTGTFYDASLNLYNSDSSLCHVLNSGGNKSIFLAKYDSSGTPLWGSMVKGENVDVKCICIDGNNIYITGNAYGNSLSLYDSDASLSNVLNFAGSKYCAFIVKYDSNGTPLWGANIGGEINNYGKSICTSNNNVYITGSFSDPSLNLYNSDSSACYVLNNLNPVNLNFGGTNNTFIAKYDSSGTPLWGAVIGGLDGDTGKSIYIENENLYITGSFNDSQLNIYDSDFNLSYVLNKNGNDSIFIVKYDLSGIPLWGSVIGGAIIEDGLSLTAYNNNIYITGKITGPDLNIFDSDASLCYVLNNSAPNALYGASNSFVVKYDSSGTPLWGSLIGGSGNNGTSICRDNNNLFITGQFNSLSMDFYNSDASLCYILNNVNPNGGNNGFIAKYNFNGTPLLSSVIGGIENSDVNINAICVTNNGQIIPVPTSNICFLKGTPILTDQGLIEIQNITNQNTINGICVEYITQTTTMQEYLVCIEKNALSENIPTQRTVITRNHNVLYDGNLVQAYKLPNIEKITYNGEILYNVLLKENGFMNVNNLICETLDINNAIAHLYRCKKNNDERIKELNNIKDKDMYKRKILEILTN